MMPALIQGERNKDNDGAQTDMAAVGLRRLSSNCRGAPQRDRGNARCPEFGEGSHFVREGPHAVPDALSPT